MRRMSRLNSPISKLDFDLKNLLVAEEKIWFDDISDIEDYVLKGRESW